ncbi:hypothetical protein SK128_024792, partial [Halocaridina rubra]
MCSRNSLCYRLSGLFEPWPRDTNWLVLLCCLGCAWLAATVLTALGMYMLACHRTKHTSTLIETKLLEQYPGCSGDWSQEDAQIALVTGSICNIGLMLVLVILTLKEKRLKRAKEDPPPNYETVMKCETPPPTFEELNFERHHSTTSNEATLRDYNTTNELNETSDFGRSSSSPESESLHFETRDTNILIPPPSPFASGSVIYTLHSTIAPAYDNPLMTV